MFFSSAILSRPALLRYVIAAMLICVPVGAVLAQSGTVKISSTEDVVIAFYKTGGSVPNFEKWIRANEPFRTTPLARRPQVMAEETARLRAAYNAFDPARHFIVIKTTAIARAVQAPDPANPDETITTLEMRFQAGDADHFPYDFMGERFAVIPQDLKNHMNPRLMNEQFEYMQNVLKNGVPVTMIVELRPVKADMEEPFNIDGSGDGAEINDGKGQWMFLTDIATMSIWNKNGAILWEYTAPWYVTPMRDSLLDLHRDKSAGE